MAAYMTINSKYSSWKEFYLSKKKETKGFLEETIKFKDSSASTPPLTFVNDPFAFMKVIDFFEGENFLLLPAGGSRVSMVHNCFTADVDDS